MNNETEKRDALKDLVREAALEMIELNPTDSAFDGDWAAHPKLDILIDRLYRTDALLVLNDLLAGPVPGDFREIATAK